MEIHSGRRYCHRKTGKVATVLMVCFGQGGDIELEPMVVYWCSGQAWCRTRAEFVDRFREFDPTTDEYP